MAKGALFPEDMNVFLEREEVGSLVEKDDLRDARYR